MTITSKYNDQYKIFHENYPTIPTTIGVRVIGDRNLLLNRNFIINKGKKSGKVLVIMFLMEIMLLVV